MKFGRAQSFGEAQLFTIGSSRLPRPDLPSFHWCSLSAASLFQSKAYFFCANRLRGSFFRNRDSPSSPTLPFARPFRRFLPKPLKLVQDFCTGALLLWPLLILGKDFDNSWSEPPRFRVFLAGAFIFSLGCPPPTHWLRRAYLLSST
jgi:hypothetical protein